MAKAKMWIIVKILDHSLGWGLHGWGNLGDAIRFLNQNCLLPHGGKWIPWATNPNYDWAEGDLINEI